MTRALFIIDVQNDFTEGGALGVDGGAAAAAAISRYLLDSADRYSHVFASRDWHDADNDNGGHFATTREPDFVTTWPVHCVAGTSGADFHPALTVDDDVIQVKKGQGVPAYSIFEGVTDRAVGSVVTADRATVAEAGKTVAEAAMTVAEAGMTVAEALEALDIDEIDVVGIATDYCVLASALDAVALASIRHVRVLEDLIAGVAPDSSAAALESLRVAGVAVEHS